MTRIEDSVEDYTWKSIPGFSDYYACREGLIASTKLTTMRILSPIKAQDGHLYVFLYRGRHMIKQWVHRLILITFVGERKDNEESRHLNGNPTDNRVDNLAWGTRQDNADDRVNHGRSQRGENSTRHKLTELQVLQIRQRAGKETLRSLGKEFGVSHTCIRRATLGINWKHLEPRTRSNSLERLK